MTLKSINIDITAPLGPIKPLHGVGGGPVSNHFTFDASEWFAQAGIPFGRTHDIEYPFGSGEFVDVHCLFPLFDADENDPANYNFTLTDEYLRLMLASGTQPFYRLGAAIEHQPIKRHIHPPKDFDKWASICSHIIAHYNDGWANGYHWNIQYWEIWNEPDIPQCWTGTDDEILELYRVTASLIKREHPDVKVGGLALTSPRCRLFEPFLAYCQTHDVPLDFVSWHGYCHRPQTAVDNANLARSLMHKYGFDGAESIYDEWNYVVDWNNLLPSVDLHRTAFGAAFMAAMISAMQPTGTDKMMFYDAQMLMKDWNNLFEPLPMTAHAAQRGVRPVKGHYTLLGWNELYQAGTQVRCDAPKDIYATAAVDGSGKTLVYLSYYNDDAGLNACPPEEAQIALTVNGQPVKALTLHRVDDTHDFTPEAIEGGQFTMPGNSYCLVEISN